VLQLKVFPVVFLLLALGSTLYQIVIDAVFLRATGGQIVVNVIVGLVLGALSIPLTIFFVRGILTGDYRQPPPPLPPPTVYRAYTRHVNTQNYGTNL